MKTLALVLATLTLCPIPSVFAQSPRPAITDSAYNWQELDRALQSFVPGTVRGMTVMITHRGKVIYGKGFGNRRLDSVFPLASATKMPSAIIIMKLVEQGLIDLDAPITNYIRVPNDKQNITVRMLFNHTSGFSGERTRCLSDRGTTLQACAARILANPLQFAPGTGFAYGGDGMQIAGYIAEVVSGKPWHQLFAEILAAPLELDDFTYTDTQNPRIGGGAYSNSQDYIKILQMLLNQGRYRDQQILLPQTIVEMERNQIRGLPIVSVPPNSEGRAMGYSFGWWHSDPKLHPDSQGPEFSDQGAFGATPWIDRDLDYGAIILIAKNVATANQIWDTIRPIVSQQIKSR